MSIATMLNVRSRYIEGTEPSWNAKCRHSTSSIPEWLGLDLVTDI